MAVSHGTGTSGQDRSAIRETLRRMGETDASGCSACSGCSSSARSGPAPSWPTGSGSPTRSVRRDVERLRTLGLPGERHPGRRRRLPARRRQGAAAAASRRRGGDRHRGLAARWRRAARSRARARPPYGRWPSSTRCCPPGCGAEVRAPARRDHHAGGRPGRGGRRRADGAGAGGRDDVRVDLTYAAPERPPAERRVEPYALGGHRPAVVPAGLGPRSRRLAHASAGPDERGAGHDLAVPAAGGARRGGVRAARGEREPVPLRGARPAARAGRGDAGEGVGGVGSRGRRSTSGPAGSSPAPTASRRSRGTSARWRWRSPWRRLPSCARPSRSWARG